MAKPELTLRGLIIGCLITLVFTAANVYFGLKAGLTFATSIPAAVISMALLYKFDSSLQENNIVQTLASSAGTLSAIIFVLPALIIIGWWQDFPYVITFAICLLGGLLGVAWSTPLRRVLVVNSDLPYPEGVACAEVLEVGDNANQGPEHKSNLIALIGGAVIAAGFALLNAMGLVAGKIASWFHTREGIFGGGLDLSFALFAVGYLVGPAVGIAMLVGTLITLFFAIPHYTLGGLDIQLAAQVGEALSSHIRYIGAGCIGITAVWALLSLMRPLWDGIKSLLAKRGELAQTERDLPLSVISLLIVGSLPFIAWLLGGFLNTTDLPHHAGMIIGSLVFILVAGILVATVCGYMAGLIGSSNSPLSGVGILVTLAASALLLPLRMAVPDGNSQLAAFAIIVTSIVFAGATIANDNLQDLKTGHMVGATPWKQQLALIIGVVAGSLVIPWVLNLLAQAYGFQGMPGADPMTALPAPQAGIMATLATGLLEHQLPWQPLLAGVAIGIGAIIVDLLLRRSSSRYSLPPLAVGLGMYLSPLNIAMIVLGALAAGAIKWSGRGDDQRPLLMAAGMIVGESLFGILMAVLIVSSGDKQPLQLLTNHWDGWLGGLLFLIAILSCHRWLKRTYIRSH